MPDMPSPFMFCDTMAGASANTNLQSLIETDTASHIGPYANPKMIRTE